MSSASWTHQFRVRALVKHDTRETDPSDTAVFEFTSDWFNDRERAQRIAESVNCNLGNAEIEVRRRGWVPAGKDLPADPEVSL